MKQLPLAGMFQVPLFDIEGAREARDEAIDKVEEHASPEFKDAAASAVRTVAAATAYFIVDEVWKAMGDEWESVGDKRAMGAIMQQAKRDGLIAPTTMFRASAQVQCHANPRRVWQSLCYGGR
jgi:predicted secreted protein